MIELIKQRVHELKHFLPIDDYWYCLQLSENELIERYYKIIRPIELIIKSIPKLSELSRTNNKTNVYLRYYSFDKDWFILGLEEIQEHYFVKVIVCKSGKISRTINVSLSDLTSFLYNGKDFFCIDYKFKPIIFGELKNSFLKNIICPRSLLGF